MNALASAWIHLSLKPNMILGQNTLSLGSYEQIKQHHNCSTIYTSIIFNSCHFDVQLVTVKVMLSVTCGLRSLQSLWRSSGHSYGSFVSPNVHENTNMCSLICSTQHFYSRCLYHVFELCLFTNHSLFFRWIRYIY